MIVFSLPVAESTFSTCMSRPGQTENTVALASNYTVVMKYNPILLKTTGNIVRLTFEGALSGGSTVISAAYIGLGASTGDAWDFSTTPVQVTWDNGTNTSKTILKGTVAVSDELTFTVDRTVPVLIAMNITSGSFSRYSSGLSLSNFIQYNKASVSEAATVNKGASYTVFAGYNSIISLIETAP